MTSLLTKTLKKKKSIEMVKNKNNNLSDEDNKLWETVSNKAVKYKKTNRIILSDKVEIKTQPLKEEMQSVAKKRHT